MKNWIIFLVIGVMAFPSCESAEELKQNVLEFTLNSLGDKLFAMVAESPAKENLQEKYDQFKQRVLTGDVESDEVEALAANIMNASNSEDSLTVEQAEDIVLFASLQSQDDQASPQPKMQASALEELGQRLHKLFEFNEQLRHSAINNRIDRHEIPKNVFIDASDGLKVRMDENWKFKFENGEGEDFAMMMKEMSEQNMLKLEKDFARNLEANMEEYRVKMEKFEGFIQNTPNPQFDEAMKHLKQLENMHVGKGYRFMQHVDMDSIHQLINESLKIAGVDSIDFSPE